jgi:uncharacterized protein (TIGR00251 family)
MINPPFLREGGSGVTLEVSIAPKSSRDAVLGEHGGRLKIALTAPPVDGKANEALIAFLASALGVPKRNITILRGQSSRQKVVEVMGVSSIQAVQALQAPKA